MAITSTVAKFTKCGDTIDITPAAAIAAGAIKVVAGMPCLALSALEADVPGTLKILKRGEVVTVTTNEAIGATEAGVAVYVTTGGIVTKTEGTNTLLGHTAKAVGATDLAFDVICA